MRPVLERPEVRRARGDRGLARTADLLIVVSSVTPEPPCSLVLLLRSVDERIPVELVEQGRRARLELGPDDPGLARSALARGVDLELLIGSKRFVLEDVDIVELSRDGRALVLHGPLELQEAPRRAGFREAVELPVRLFAAKEQRRLAIGRTADLGGGGISIETPRPFEAGIGDEVRVEVDLDDDEPPVRAGGRVVWLTGRRSGHTSAGIAFDEVEGRGHDRLHRFLFGLQRARRASSSPSAKSSAPSPKKA